MSWLGWEAAPRVQRVDGVLAITEKLDTAYGHDFVHGAADRYHATWQERVNAILTGHPYEAAGLDERQTPNGD